MQHQKGLPVPRSSTVTSTGPIPATLRVLVVDTADVVISCLLAAPAYSGRSFVGSRQACPADSVGVVGGRDGGVTGHHLDGGFGRQGLTCGDHVAEIVEVLHVEVGRKGVE